MSSSFTHIIIPLFILFIFSEQFKLSKRTIFLFCFFAILPDLDVFVFHRATLHNIFILFVPLCIYIFWKDIKLSCIMAFYMFSHIMLDLFNRGVYLFYPFYNKVIYLMVGVSYKDSIVSPIYELIIEDDISNRFFEMPIISSENMATAFLIITTIIVMFIKKHKSINTKTYI